MPLVIALLRSRALQEHVSAALRGWSAVRHCCDGGDLSRCLAFDDVDLVLLELSTHTDSSSWTMMRACRQDHPSVPIVAYIPLSTSAVRMAVYVY